MARAASSPPFHSHRPASETTPSRDIGRGARSNMSGRYEAHERSLDEQYEPSSPEEAKLVTTVTLERPRTIINYVESPFVGFDRSINIYRGCEHGCIYCFARPSHAYYGLSPGIDFEARIFAKPNAGALLDRELASPKYKPRHIAIGTNTDPYQPTERKLRIMRDVLTTLHRYNHPVSLLTKSALIERDIDLMKPMAERGTVKAMLSITTLNSRLARTMEPRASSPKRRLQAVEALAKAGIKVGVMVAPIIPGLNDHETEALVDAAKSAGAGFAGYTIIRLPLEVSDLFREWLEAAFPDRASRVMRHIRDMNGGKDYDPKWTRAEKPRSTLATLIDARFRAACRRAELSTEMPKLDGSLFQRPLATGGQLSLFDESS